MSLGVSSRAIVSTRQIKCETSYWTNFHPKCKCRLKSLDIRSLTICHGCKHTASIVCPNIQRQRFKCLHDSHAIVPASLLFFKTAFGILKPVAAHISRYGYVYRTAALYRNSQIHLWTHICTHICPCAYCHLHQLSNSNLLCRRKRWQDTAQLHSTCLHQHLQHSSFTRATKAFGMMHAGPCSQKTPASRLGAQQSRRCSAVP